MSKRDKLLLLDDMLQSALKIKNTPIILILIHLCLMTRQLMPYYEILR